MAFCTLECLAKIAANCYLIWRPRRDLNPCYRRESESHNYNILGRLKHIRTHLNDPSDGFSGPEVVPAMAPSPAVCRILVPTRPHFSDYLSQLMAQITFAC